MSFNNYKTGIRSQGSLDHMQRDQDDLIYKHLWGEGHRGLEETNTCMTHRTTAQIHETARELATSHGATLLGIQV